MPVTVEHDIADHQDSGLIESRHGQLHGATHIQNEQGRDISTGFAMACDHRRANVGGDLLSVGASLLAKNSQTPRLFRKRGLSLRFFASELAPTFPLHRDAGWIR